MPESAVVAAAREPVRIEQLVALRPFLGLSLRNGLLNLITLTLYRFWGSAVVRQRLWSAIRINEEPLEYTGRRAELSLPFLRTLGLTALPILILVVSVRFRAPSVSGLAALPLILGLVLLMGVDRFAAFRDVAHHTAWRGKPLYRPGSALGYGLLFLGCILLSVLTLGWFWPAAARRLAARRWDGLTFDDQAFTFDIVEARKDKIYGVFALAWTIGLAGFALLTLAAGAVFGPALQEMGRRPSLEQTGALYMICVVGAVAYSVALAPFHAAMLRSLVRGLAFRDLRFALQMTWRELAWLKLSNLALLTITLGCLAPFVGARTSRFLLQRLSVTGVLDADSAVQVTQPSKEVPPGAGEVLSAPRTRRPRG